jgi:hypothetical protein
VSAALSKAAVARVAAKREEHGAEGFGAYAFLVLGMLAHQAPEVVEFILDRADEAMSTRPGNSDGSSA